MLLLGEERKRKLEYLSMSKKEIELTAYCGLYCGDCIRYKSRASDLSRELLKELRNIEFGKFADIKGSSEKQFGAVEQFKHYKECYEVLEAIAALRCNDSCRAGGGCSAFKCEILECCLKKSYKGCWECDELDDCEKFEFSKPLCGNTLKRNIKIIKEKGIEGWSRFRNKFYVWQ